MAAGGGFTGEALVKGLNPLDPNQLSQVANFMGHTLALNEAIAIVYDAESGLAAKLASI
jgi:hypothetical protein